MTLTIAIDGGTRTGKSTTAERLAAKLGLLAISTGALFRTWAWLTLQLNLDPDDEIDCNLSALRLIQLGFRFIDADHAELGGDVLGPKELRNPEVTAASSKVAVHAHARRLLLPLQRDPVACGGVVEGRDIGTVVLPNADLKIFLTVTPEERLRRALKRDGYAAARTDAERDLRETTRTAAPLIPAADAIIIDTTDRPIDEIVRQILDTVTKLTSPDVG